MDQTNPAGTVGTASKRIIWLDIARGGALFAMAVYHFAWDLEFFGYVAHNTTTTGGWKLFARSIAGSFLFLAGASLVLAHHPVIRWRSFWRRLAMIVVAAAGISLVSYQITPDTFIFFGILHAIAAGSLIGMAFLHLPPAITLAAAAAALAAPSFFASPIFDTPLLWWVGLSTTRVNSNDYVPLLPWLGPVLAGIAAMRLARAGGLTEWLRQSAPAMTLPARAAAFCGRHSLAFYLVHQPVLFGLVFAASTLAPAPVTSQAYLQNCQAGCRDSAGDAFCARFCRCTLEELRARELFGAVMEGSVDVGRDPRITGLADQCTARALEENGRMPSIGPQPGTTDQP